MVGTDDPRRAQGRSEAGTADTGGEGSHRREVRDVESAQFKAIFDWSPIATLVIRSTDGSIIAANRACERLFGWTPSELVTKTAEDLGLTTPMWSEGARSDQDPEPIERILTKDGQERRVLTSITPVEPGAEPRLLALLHDMTERELLRERLQRSEEAMQTFLDFAPAVITTRDLDGQLLMRNQRFVAEFHRPTDGDGRAGAAPGLPPEVVRWSEEIEAEVARTGRAVRAERTIPGRQGDVTWDFTKFPLHDPSGEVFAVGTIAVDVTEDHKARSELADSEERFRQMATSLDEVFLLWEVDTIDFLYISPALERITGLTEEQFRDPEARTAAIHPDDRPIIGSPPAPQKEVRIVKPDGQVRWIRTRTSMVETPAGQADRGATTLTDITEQKVAEIEAHAARERAERADRAKSDLLSGMSHELRTPLNAILGFGQLLAMNETFDAEAHEQANEIIRAGRHLLDLINDLLDIARIESGHVTVNLEPIPLGPMIDEAVALLRPVAADAHIRLLVDDISPHVHVHADRRGLRQVLLNLVSNAVKYNAAGGMVRVSVPQPVGTGVRIVIEDTGVGIDPAQRARVFQPFVRLQHEDSHVQGSGLGLALCRQLLDLMGGTIDFESQPGTGSRFWFELPGSAARPAPAPREDLEPPASPAVRRGAPRTVLLIEDNASNIRLVQEILALRPDVTVAVISKGTDALDAARNLRPFLILLDVNLPDIDGNEVLRRLQADDATATIPTVAVSADATAAQRARMLEHGAAEYLTKPFEVDRLLAVVDAAVASSDAPSRPGGAPHHPNG